MEPAPGNVIGSHAALPILLAILAFLTSICGRGWLLPMCSVVLLLKLHHVGTPRRLKAVWSNSVEIYDRGTFQTIDDLGNAVPDEHGANPWVSHAAD